MARAESAKCADENSDGEEAADDSTGVDFAAKVEPVKNRTASLMDTRCGVSASNHGMNDLAQLVGDSEAAKTACQTFVRISLQKGISFENSLMEGWLESIRNRAGGNEGPQAPKGLSPAAPARTRPFTRCCAPLMRAG